jgi:hypothetical protein
MEYIIPLSGLSNPNGDIYLMEMAKEQWDNFENAKKQDIYLPFRFINRKLNELLTPISSLTQWLDSLGVRRMTPELYSVGVIKTLAIANSGMPFYIIFNEIS